VCGGGFGLAAKERACTQAKLGAPLLEFGLEFGEAGASALLPALPVAGLLAEFEVFGKQRAGVAAWRRGGKGATLDRRRRRRERTRVRRKIHTNRMNGTQLQSEVSRRTRSPNSYGSRIVSYLRHAILPLPATVRRVEVELDGFEVPADVLEFIPASVAYENVLLPLGFHGDTLVLVMQDPLDADLVTKMEFIFNHKVAPVAAPRQQVAEAIRRHYGDPVFSGGEPDFSGWPP
jgi:hypothetical protein